MQIFNISKLFYGVNKLLDAFFCTMLPYGKSLIHETIVLRIHRKPIAKPLHSYSAGCCRYESDVRLFVKLYNMLSQKNPK